MSCVLRAAGKEFDVDGFLKKSKLKPCAVYRKGEPKFKTKPKGEKNKFSGINIVVSKADFDSLKKQIKDAIKFLEKNKNEIRKLTKCLGIVNAPELDFGIGHKDVVVQSNRLSSKLLALCGKLGIDIALSQYPQSENDEEK